MDREENFTTGEEISPEKPQVKQRKIWPYVTVTAVIAIFATMALTTALFISRFGTRIEFANRYFKLFELDRIIMANYIGQIDQEALLDSAAAGMVDGLGDRWSSYMTAEQLNSYSSDLDNSYVGVGINVTKMPGEYITVTSVNSKGGAFDAGVQVDDIIKAVDGTDIKDMALNDCTALIKGDEGTFVDLLIERDGVEMTISVERRSLPDISVKYELIDNVGYVKLLNFYQYTAEEFIEAVENLIAEGAESFVFDVRFNGGGYLSELYTILDYVLPEGVIFKTADINGKITTIESDASCLDMPIAVLINDRTISAAEYFAAVISEYERGVLVGEPTLGKGYSQKLFRMLDGSGVNLSTAKYYTPNGTCLVDLGLTPDILVEVSDEEYAAVYYKTLDYSEDSQLIAALDTVK